MAVYTMLGFDSVLTKCASVGYFDKILFETFILNYFCVFFMFFSGACACSTNLRHPLELVGVE